MVDLVIHTLLLALVVTGICLLIGVPLGLLLGRTNLPLRVFWIATFTIPVLLPPYILAVGWRSLVYSLSGFWGCVFILSSAFVPIVLWLTLMGVQGVNPASEEAGLLVYGWRRVVPTITLSTAAPSIFLGGLLVFILTVSEFGIPSFFRWNTLAVEIFTRYAAFSDLMGSLRACLILIPLILAALGAEFFLLKNKAFSWPQANRTMIVIPLGVWRWPLVCGVALLSFLLFILPGTQIVYQAGPWSDYARGLWTAGRSLATSIFYSVTAATVITALGFLIGYFLLRKRSFMFRAINVLILLLFAIPSAMLAVIQIFVWNRPSTFFLYSSAFPLVFAYCLQYLAIPTRVSYAHLRQIPVSWEEASFLSGTSRWMHFSKILWPLSKRGIMIAWSLSWIFCVKDLGLSMLLYPPGHQTLTVRLFTLMPNSSPNTVAVLSLMVGSLALIPVIGMLGFMPRQFSQRRGVS